MNISLQCKQCQHRWTLTDEPRLLLSLQCPACQKSPLPLSAVTTTANPSSNAANTMANTLPPLDEYALEDLSSALEDALTQLSCLHQQVSMEITLDSENIPKQFLPKKFEEL